MPSGVYKHKKGIKFTEEHKQKISTANKGVKKSESHKNKLRIAKIKNPVRYWLGKKRESMQGKNHYNWKGGLSRGYKNGYYSAEYKKWRNLVFERDKYTCIECGIKGNKVYITAHHIKSFAHYPELRYEISNGKTLCEECHKLTDNYKGRAVTLKNNILSHEINKAI